MNKMKNPSVELILSFTQIGAMLRARRYLIFIVTMIAVLGAGVTSMLLPKTYVATADIFIDYRVNDPIGGRSFILCRMKAICRRSLTSLKVCRWLNV
jgi:uncharacterized protein involved in exopolysaccharide biosynthesis